MINKNFYHKDLIPFDIKKHLIVFIAKKSQKESSSNILIEKKNKKARIKLTIHSNLLYFLQIATKLY